MFLNLTQARFFGCDTCKEAWYMKIICISMQNRLLAEGVIQMLNENGIEKQYVRFVRKPK